ARVAAWRSSWVRGEVIARPLILPHPKSSWSPFLPNSGWATRRHLRHHQPGERPADEEIGNGHRGVTRRKSPPIPVRNMANHAGRESQHDHEDDALPITWERGFHQ